MRERPCRRKRRHRCFRVSAPVSTEATRVPCGPGTNSTLPRAKLRWRAPGAYLKPFSPLAPAASDKESYLKESVTACGRAWRDRCRAHPIISVALDSCVVALTVELSDARSLRRQTRALYPEPRHFHDLTEATRAIAPTIVRSHLNRLALCACGSTPASRRDIVSRLSAPRPQPKRRGAQSHPDLTPTCSARAPTSIKAAEAARAPGGANRRRLEDKPV